MKKLAVLMALLLLFPCLAGARQQNMTPRQVHALLKEGSGLWLIDIRSPAVFARGYIEGAVNIPAQELAGMKLPDSTILVLIDNSLGQLQAQAAARKLQAAGHKKVFVLTAGVRGWQLAGLPLVLPGGDYPLARVYPGELEAAQAAGVALQLFDMRTPLERRQQPLVGCQALPEGNFVQRMEVIREQLSGGADYQPPVLSAIDTTVVVVPATVNAPQVYRKYFQGLAVDIRILEGGYVAETDGQQMVSGRCPTCPGS